MAATGVVNYRLDPAASKFTVQAFAEGLFSMFGHDPVIGVKDFMVKRRLCRARLKMLR